MIGQLRRHTPSTCYAMPATMSSTWYFPPSSIGRTFSLLSLVGIRSITFLIVLFQLILDPISLWKRMTRKLGETMCEFLRETKTRMKYPLIQKRYIALIRKESVKYTDTTFTPQASKACVTDVTSCHVFGKKSGSDESLQWTPYDRTADSPGKPLHNGT